MSNRLILPILAVLFTAAVSFGLNAFAATFVEPSGAPPANNAYAPLDTSSNSNTKAGGLILNGGFLVNPNFIVTNVGKVGIGTLTPAQPLEVAGIIKSSAGGFMFPDGTTQTTAGGGVGSGAPAGQISSFYLSTCPTGWILANGSNGTPDLRGVFVRGLDGGRGLDTGRTLGSYQTDELKNHTHTVPMVTAAYGWGTTPAAVTRAGSTETSPTGGSETRPKNVALIYCMKQ